MIKRLVIVLLILVAAVVGGRHLYVQGLEPRNPQGEPKLVYLQHGQGAWALASVLEDEGIIRSAPVFYVAYKLYAHRGGDVSMQGSYFDLSPADGVTTIIEQRLKEPASRRVTFPEGFSMAQMGTRLGDAGLMISEQAFTAAAVPSTVAEGVDFPLPTESLEGYLFPDTYEFVVGTEPEDIVEVMASTFSRKFFQTHAEEIKSSGFSLHEIVTMASLIEREARIGADRPLISSVIRNRLVKKMRLQIDATVQYALPEHKERLTHEDLKTPSRYNTYLHAGLPPGPICSPGLACLEAALRPAKTDYLFYVARPDGSHVFTKTYEEHLAAIRAIRGG